MTRARNLVLPLLLPGVLPAESREARESGGNMVLPLLLPGVLPAESREARESGGNEVAALWTGGHHSRGSSSWLYTWTGETRSDYRVRVTIKFSPDRKKLEMKSEAQYQLENDWEPGSDTALLQTLKTDIMGKVGRTTR